MTEQELKDSTLLADVKNYLDITWNDDAADKKLTGIINRGKSYLQNIAGGFSIDFAVECNARSLLFDYCRYARSNALEMFEPNFKSQLIGIRLANKVSLVATKEDAPVDN